MVLIAVMPIFHHYNGGMARRRRPGKVRLIAVGSPMEVNGGVKNVINEENR